MKSWKVQTQAGLTSVASASLTGGWWHPRPGYTCVLYFGLLSNVDHLNQTEFVKQTAAKDEDRHTRYPKEGFGQFSGSDQCSCNCFSAENALNQQIARPRARSRFLWGTRKLPTGVERKFAGTWGIWYVLHERNKYQPSVSKVILKRGTKSTNSKSSTKLLLRVQFRWKRGRVRLRTSRHPWGPHGFVYQQRNVKIIRRVYTTGQDFRKFTTFTIVK